MIEEMQYPVTPYAFDIETSMGDLRIEMESTEFDAPSKFEIKTYGGNAAPESVLRRYFHEFGFGMRGHRIEMEGDRAFPSDFYHVLTMSRTYLQEGKQSSILDFQIMGFVPRKGYVDLFVGPEGDGEDDNILESAESVLMTLTGKELGENIDSESAVEVAKNYYRAKMQGKIVTRPSVGDVRFSGKGWKKFRRGITTDIKKAKLLPAAPVVVRLGKHSVSELYKSRPDNIVRFHFFDGKIELEGQVLLVGVTVGEDDRGCLFYNLNHDPDVLIEKRKAPSLPRLEARGLEPSIGEHDAHRNRSIDAEDRDVNITESASIDREANKAASSPKNSLPEPTEAQKEAGNYRKGHVTIRGLDIAIENPAGSERSGVNRDGKKWTSKMRHHYGYFKGTRGRDKDHLDVFLGPDPENADKVFIVNQTSQATGSFDEHKIMWGFETEDEARAAYLSNYEEGWQGLGSICTLFVDEFKDWLKNGDTTIPVERGVTGSYHQDPSWVGVDLDGTLAKYDGWVGEDHIGEPIPLMMAFVKRLVREGKRVKIFTARASDPEKIPPVKKWLERNGLGDLEVTNVKDQNMTMLYDDRAAKVIANTGVILEKARQSAIMERSRATYFRGAVQGAVSFDDIEDVFAATFGPIVVKRFIFGEISELENQIKAMREKLAQVMLDNDGTGIVQGEKTTAYLNDNSPIDLQYAVIGADRLVTSHTDELSLNRDFSQDLQPRDRAREGMRLQVEQMAGKLNPERLGESTSVSTGAPIIGQDLTVESGNGRTIAIRKAYTAGEKGQEYKQWLVTNADQFGISGKAIESMERPVLVRIRLTEIDRSEFARKANEDEIAQMAPSELAKADAARLTNDDIAFFQPSDDGNIAATTNRAFIAKFVEKMGVTASTGYMTKDGRYTKQLIDRVQAAIFQKAYQDEDLLILMAEEADPKIKNILSAMTVAAGEFSGAKAADQDLMGIDIPHHIIEAAKLIKKARQDGDAIEMVLAQGGFFEAISEDTKHITRFIDSNIRSAKRMGAVFKEAASMLKRRLIDEKTPKLIAMEEPLPTPTQILTRAIEKEKAAREVGENLFEAAGEFDWREAIEAAATFEDIQAVFESKFPEVFKTGRGKQTFPKPKRNMMINTDNGETTINHLLSRMARARGDQKRDLYLSTYGDDRRALIEAAILKLPAGEYTLSIEGRAAPSLQRTIIDKYGVWVGVDVTEPLVRGMAVKYPEAIQATFTLGLQEIRIITRRR